MLELKPIRVFLEVASRQSFASAARALGMTPATVTRVVARLEEDLGQQLLVRTTRQVSLTSAGAVVAARYRPLVAEFDRIAEEMDAETQPNRGRLAINAPMSFGLRVMPGLVDQFRLAYPHVELVVHLTDRLVDIVEDACDLAIRLSAPPTDKSTIWRRICEIPRHLVASRAYLDLQGRPTVPEDLETHNRMSYGTGKEPEIWRLQSGGTLRSVTAGTEIVTNNGDFLKSLVETGQGIALLPDFIINPGLSDGTLEPVLPEWTPPALALSLFYPPYQALPPLVATFTDFFEAYLADLDGFDFGR